MCVYMQTFCILLIIQKQKWQIQVSVASSFHINPHWAESLQISSFSLHFGKLIIKKKFFVCFNIKTSVVLSSKTRTLWVLTGVRYQYQAQDTNTPWILYPQPPVYMYLITRAFLREPGSLRGKILHVSRSWHLYWRKQIDFGIEPFDNNCLEKFHW